MNNNINFGIDLGTTNSLIAKFQDGKVEIFKNPYGQKLTLPSVIAFRKDRIIVGDKARELTEKDPENVFASFKRKMGTSESFFVPNLGDFKTPAALSAQVLKELRNFVHTGETPDSVVITIPASFDTIQSNATKKAGYEAGFKEVALLQEPIAASLAFANKQDAQTKMQGQWLVYDLGGGTFDVALVRFSDGEMRVIDHEGDNYLGGVDFDMAMIDHLVIPYLEKRFTLPDLSRELKGAKGKYNTLYYVLIKKAEEVKVQLTNDNIADLEFEITDQEGIVHDICFPITRQDFEGCIYNKVSYSIDLVKKILARNQVSSTAVKEVVLIGGSTYIPLVKQLVAKELGIMVNSTVDPTTAVVIGAAYYAGSKVKQPPPDSAKSVSEKGLVSVRNIKFKTAYQKVTQDREEYFTAIVSGDLEECTYRIVRTDGGYDSGIKVLKERISEVLLLAPDTCNSFELIVFDGDNQPVPVQRPVIEITHGKFSVQGQPLPNDICIEVDDIANNTTRLEVIFEKNAILPLRKVITRELVKTIMRGSDDSLVINVVEGSRYAVPLSCVPVGVIEITARELETDLVKGSDIEIILEMSESRDLTITATLLMNDQGFSNVFSPSVRQVNMNKLREELTVLHRHTLKALKQYENSQEYELAAALQSLESEINQVIMELREHREDDVTDKKYQLEEKKRKLAQRLDAVGKEQQLVNLVEQYLSL
jgi:molecular chaperone DnaK